ncbi:hypothetical protein H5410_006803 [Solanum commersonii]|uniref:Uncharacterized protein n=1 Tax=Solanum commersonii TaxID=4109 RepID=A0A9J6AAT9_SOLCO|nr:hypothetical protein H5410_006803 [Solanum commersonii]
MLRLYSLLKITLTNKRRYPDREPNNRIGDVSWKIIHIMKQLLKRFSLDIFSMYNDNPCFS